VTLQAELGALSVLAIPLADRVATIPVSTMALKVAAKVQQYLERFIELTFLYTVHGRLGSCLES
jgi:hypothetical protein